MLVVMRAVCRYCADVFLIIGLFLAASSAQITSSPSTLTFTSTYLGMSTTTKTITIRNTGTTATTLTAIASNCQEFKLASGQTPFTLAPNKTTTYSMYFAPDAAKTFHCDYTLTQQTGSPLQVPLTGTGLQSQAVVG